MIGLLKAIALQWRRIMLAFTHIGRNTALALRWLFTSRETTNLTFDLTPINKAYMVAFLAETYQQSDETILGYIQELEQDQALKDHLWQQTKKAGMVYKTDKVMHYGRRIGWYVSIRLLKPKVVIETGVDKGLGACVIAAALLRNAAEGHAGQYFGTDINPKAGFLLSGEYAKVGKILYGDSIESLQAFQMPISLFINDSDHSFDYEAREYETIATKLTPDAVIISDNAEVSDKLLLFSRKHNRRFCFFQEEPLNHWFRGGGLGISLPRN